MLKRTVWLGPVLALLCTGLQAAVPDSSASFQRWGAVPVLGYSSETELQLGALLLLFFPPEKAGGEGHGVDLAFYGTTRNQWVASIGPQLRFLDERLYFDINLDYKKWPAHYFGQGNAGAVDSFNTYSMTQWRLRAPFETDLGLPGALGGRLRYGGELDIEKNNTRFDTLKDEAIGTPERQGGLRTGIGYNLSYSTTDHENWPRHGYMAKWRHLLFTEALGDWSFGWKSLDLRAYAPLPLGSALALCSFWEGVDGDAPFDRMAQPDGVRHLRGLEKGQYLDRQSWVLHSEIRAPLFWRFGGTAFYEAGKVGSYWGELWDNPWHHVVGLGARLAINQSKKLNARVDLSLVDGENVGLTVYLREAF